MISHVSVCLLAHREKGSISNTFCHTKREYSFSVRPIGCTPAFCYVASLLAGILINETPAFFMGFHSPFKSL